jgi:low temperature requirement protein LtrA
MNAPMLRERVPGHHARVTYVELFFDLVFVFAVTRISHGLIAHLDWMGALHAGMLMLCMWWAWIYTAWITNWLDPEHRTVRLMLFALMAAGLVMSTSQQEAFGERGLVFAAAYVAFQLGRTLFMLWAVRKDAALHRNFVRIGWWMAASGALWIAGGLAEGPARLGLWGLALAIESSGPAASYWVPRIGRADSHDWTIEGAHMAERCGLFVIICLGESILVTGATLAEAAWSAPVLGAFAAAFVGSLAMWWIYFSNHAELASEVIARSGDPGRIARLSYTYLHIPLVAGIIVTAASDELTLGHPLGQTSGPVATAMIGGPFLYLLGALLFKWSVFKAWSPPRLAGLAALLALAPAHGAMSPLALGAATSAILVGVGGGEVLLKGRQLAHAQEVIQRTD